MLKKIFFIFCGLLFSCQIVAENISPSQNLIQLLDPIKYLQANFTQTIYDRDQNILQQTTGIMSLQHPGKFRWEVTKPSKQLLVADGSQVWFYDVDLAQVTVQKQKAIASNSPAMLLSGSAEDLIKNFTITIIKNDSSDQAGFKLTPKTKNNFFQSVELYFQQNTLQKMRLLDNLNQITQVDFSHVSYNDLNPAIFTFHVPKNVDVVKQ